MRQRILMYPTLKSFTQIIYWIVKVGEDGTIDTMNKEELVSFVQGNLDSKVAPLSTKTDFHYAVVDGNMGMVIITRDLELGGKRKFFTLIWEYLSGRWQVVKEIIFRTRLKVMLHRSIK
jgi:hypothetical protein